MDKILRKSDYGRYLHLLNALVCAEVFMFRDISSYINKNHSSWFLTSLSDLPLEPELAR